MKTDTEAENLMNSDVDGLGADEVPSKAEVEAYVDEERLKF